MRFLFILFTFLSIQFNSISQCNVVATAMPTGTTCAGTCDGSIIYVYQNLAAPGAPYMVMLYNSGGTLISMQTYMTEIATIPYTNLCADNYTITVQGTTCSYTVMANVTSPTQITASLNTVDPTPGNTDGSVTITANGGTAGYTFSLNGTTYQAGNSFSGLSAGVYTAYVQDANGCVETFDFTLTDPSTCNIVVTAVPMNTLCTGSCSGSVFYAYNDPQNNGPYFVELILGTSVVQTATYSSSGASGTFTNVCPGTYTVVVTDLNGCSGSYSTTIFSAPPLVVASVVTTDATPGNNDGSVVITATGGTPAYTYSVDGGLTYQSSNTFIGLAPGVYIGYVMDANGCTSIYCFVIQVDPGCFFNVNAFATNPTCSGACDGSINYVFSGSPTDPTFTIQLQQGGTTIQSATNTNQTVSSSFTNLCGGNYSIVVTNSSGCSEVVNVTLTSPTYMNVTSNNTNPTIGNSDGQIDVIVSGGTGPYQFSIDNGTTWQPSNSFTNLAAGFYIILIEDANGCSSIICIILQESAACDFFLITTNSQPTCANSCDATIIYSFNDVGNNPPYVIELIQGSTVLETDSAFGNGGSGNFSGLCEGNYTVQITDANGCVDSEINYIVNPDQLIIDSVDVVDATLGNADGTAQLFVSGGTPPYQYSVSNGFTFQPSSSFSGLPPGVYISVVEDANGCSTIFCFVVNETPGCLINTTLFVTSPISCAGQCDGTLGFAYTDVANNGPYTINLLNGSTVVSTTTNASNNFSGTFTNLCAGNYSIVVENASGCNSYVSNATLTEPTALSVSAIVTNASVGNSNGSATINVTGGTGQYSYSLDGITYQSSNTFNDLAAGIYIAYVMDDNGCTGIHTFVVTENSNCNIVLTTNPIAISCSGACDGEIIFAFNDVNNNPPYTVTLTNQMGGTQTQLFTSTNGGSGTFTNLCGGVYTVTVQDADGCESIQTVTIVSPTYMMVSANTVDATLGNSDGFATINVTGGTAPYQFSTDNGVTWQTSNVLTGLGAGFYIVNIQDANGCSTIFCFILGDSNVATLLELSSDMNIYPNPTNGIVYVTSSSLQAYNLYDLSGKKLEVSQTQTAQSTSLDLSGLANGMYILIAIDANGNVERTSIVKQ